MTVVESPRPLEPRPEPVESTGERWNESPFDSLAKVDAKLKAHSAVARPFSWPAQTTNPTESTRPVDDARTSLKRAVNQSAPASSFSPGSTRNDAPILLEQFREPSWVDHRGFLQIASAVIFGGLAGSAIAWSVAYAWLL